MWGQCTQGVVDEPKVERWYTVSVVLTSVWSIHCHAEKEQCARSSYFKEWSDTFQSTCKWHSWICECLSKDAELFWVQSFWFGTRSSELAEIKVEPFTVHPSISLSLNLHPFIPHPTSLVKSIPYPSWPSIHPSYINLALLDPYNPINYYKSICLLTWSFVCESILTFLWVMIKCMHVISWWFHFWAGLWVLNQFHNKTSQHSCAVCLCSWTIL